MQTWVRKCTLNRNYLFSFAPPTDLRLSWAHFLHIPRTLPRKPAEILGFQRYSTGRSESESQFASITMNNNSIVSKGNPGVSSSCVKNLQRIQRRNWCPRQRLGRVEGNQADYCWRWFWRFWKWKILFIKLRFFFKSENFMRRRKSAKSRKLICAAFSSRYWQMFANLIPQVSKKKLEPQEFLIKIHLWLKWFKLLKFEPFWVFVMVRVGQTGHLLRQMWWKIRKVDYRYDRPPICFQATAFNYVAYSTFHFQKNLFRQPWHLVYYSIFVHILTS